MTRPGSIAALLEALEGSTRAVRWSLVGQLGHIRRRRDGRGYYLDLRPYGRVWSNRGIRITDEETARRVLEQIRGKVADEERRLPEVIAEYLPKKAKPNLVPSRLATWLEVKRAEADAGSLSPLYVDELERMADPDGHFAFFADKSIHEITYGTLEDFSLWLANRKLAPKTRRNVLACFRAFLRWLQLRGELRDVPRAPMPRAPEYEPRIIPAREQDHVLALIPDEDRGVFLALAHLGLRPGEARALDAADYHDGWITVDKAVKGKSVSSPIRGTKTGKPKRLPVGEMVADWIEQHVPRERRLRGAPLFANPRTGGRYAHKTLGEIWAKAVKAAGLPHVKLYEGTKHSFATDAIRRGVSERALQRFLGHASLTSTRRYARFAEEALLEVVRPKSEVWRQAGDKGSEEKPQTPRGVTGGPSRIRTWARPVMSRLL